MNCQVTVSQGILQGKECRTYYDKRYYSFEGIPYAKPPLGELRFRDPQGPENWRGIRDATKLGNKCSQINFFTDSSLEGSEDCLYLNVYTPSLPHEKIQKLPVLFFVHGGRLIMGYGGYYKPDYLLKHDVILVTINYRLNILGFLCLDIPEVPGNAAMKDTIMALRWVNQNIVRFNGDSSNIIVMGESAGSGMITSYLTSKMADGLYHKMIAESGVCVSRLFMHNPGEGFNMAKLVALNLGKNIGNERSLYEFLIDVPIEDLMAAYAAVEMDRDPSELKSRFLPVVEKKFDNIERFFDEYPINDIVRGNFKTVPILVGKNLHEGALFLNRDMEGNIIYENNLHNFISHCMNTKEKDRLEQIDKQLREFYFNNREINNETKLDYLNMLSDSNFNYDIIQFVELLSKNNRNVYYFIFQYLGNLNTRVMKSLGMKGSSHGDIIQYQFYRKAKHDKATENDIKIINTLTDMICDFVKNGSPSCNGQVIKWLPYTPTEKLVLLIDNNKELVKNPELHRYKFWQNISGEVSKL